MALVETHQVQLRGWTDGTSIYEYSGTELFITSGGPVNTEMEQELQVQHGAEGRGPAVPHIIPNRPGRGGHHHDQRDADVLLFKWGSYRPPPPSLVS